MARPKKERKNQPVSVYVDNEIRSMVEDLCEAFHANPSQIFRQAVVKMWHSEQALLKVTADRKTNGRLEEA